MAVEKLSEDEINTLKSVFYGHGVSVIGSAAEYPTYASLAMRGFLKSSPDIAGWKHFKLTDAGREALNGVAQS